MDRNVYSYGNSQWLAWRNLSTDEWVSFKAFGIPVLSVIFGVLSIPL